MGIPENLSRLEQFSGFQEGWNGYGAKKISPLAVSKAKELVEVVGKEFDIDVYPLADGGVQVEFDKENAGYLEFYLREDCNEKVGVFAIDKVDNTYNFNIPYNIKSICSLTREFNKGKILNPERLKSIDTLKK